jgi:hypothetical protein
LRIIGQRLRHANHAMSVTIRLDHRKHLGRAYPLADNFRVVTQCASIDFRPATITFFHFDETLFGIVI